MTFANMRFTFLTDKEERVIGAKWFREDGSLWGIAGRGVSLEAAALDLVKQLDAMVKEKQAA